MHVLRAPGGCPWDAEQTHESLVRHLLEEAYEVAAAVRSGDRDELVDELGDLLLQPFFHAEIASEAGRFDIDEVARAICEKLIRRHLYDPDQPDPELMIRTSGEHRISNFLLWEIAYSELVFTEVLWPDFRRGDLYEAIDEFQRRERRFGGLNA